MTDKEELTIKIPKDENEKAILARKAKEAKAKEAKEKEAKEKEAKDDTNSAGCMSFFFCCALFQ